MKALIVDDHPLIQQAVGNVLRALDSTVDVVVAGDCDAALGLTDRQLAVLRLIAKGASNKLICRELELAERTVKAHVSAVLRALNVGSRTQAAVEAVRLGLADAG